MSINDRSDQRVSSTLDAGTRLLGLNITAVATWIGPLALTLWALGWGVSQDPASGLPRDVTPLQLTSHLLEWSGADTERIDAFAGWIKERDHVLGALGVLGAACGISWQHNIGVVAPLLLAVEAMGAGPAYLSLLALTAGVAVVAALITPVKGLHVGRRLRAAGRSWVSNVVADVVLLPVLVAMGLLHKLGARYLHGDSDLYTSADELNDQLSEHIPDLEVKVTDLSAADAARALALVMAATRDEGRAAEIVRHARSLRRKQPTGATSLAGYIDHYHVLGHEPHPS